FPTNWTYLISVINSMGGHAILTPSENRIEGIVSTVAGSIGYKILYSNTADISTDFSIIRYTQDTNSKSSSIVHASADSLISCGNNAVIDMTSVQPLS